MDRPSVTRWFAALPAVGVVSASMFTDPAFRRVNQAAVRPPPVPVPVVVPAQPRPAGPAVPAAAVAPAPPASATPAVATGAAPVPTRLAPPRRPPPPASGQSNPARTEFPESSGVQRERPAR